MPHPPQPRTDTAPPCASRLPRRPRTRGHVTLPPALAVHGAIPEYPDAVPLTADRWRLVAAAIAREQPALAELSFFSLHLWHGGDEVRLSRIGAFLVATLTDQPRQATVIALPGAALTRSVLECLTAFLTTHAVRFVSAPTAAALRPMLARAGLEAVSSRDDADYLLSIQRVAELSGPELGSKRKAAGRLERRHEVSVREGRLTDTWANAHLIRAYDRWCAAKYGSVRAIPAALAHERTGLMAWPRGRAAADVRVFALTVDDEPAGVSVVEPMWDHTWMGIVFKADPDLPGATPYLRRAVAQAGLEALGPHGLLNIQQDDGLAGLRVAKTAYQPLRLASKFRILPTPGTAAQNGHPAC